MARMNKKTNVFYFGVTSDRPNEVHAEVVAEILARFGLGTHESIAEVFDKTAGSKFCPKSDPNFLKHFRAIKVTVEAVEPPYGLPGEENVAKN